MKNKNINVDMLLKNALSSTEKPNPELVQKVKYSQIKEVTILKKTTIRRLLTTAATVVMSFTIFTSTAFAAWYFMKPSEVAGKFEDTALSAAFESESAVNINESVTSGGYNFTLLALVSGKDITDHPIYDDGGIKSDRTYAVLAIQKADGSPIDDEYGVPAFFVSPYVKGQKPWQLNAHTLSGGSSEMVVDGILYRIFECDEITIFADRGLYLGVNTGSISDQRGAFIYNEQTGELRANPDYDGSSAVFTLPVDESLADPVKAQEYLDKMWDVPVTNTPESMSDNASENGSGIKKTMTYDEYKAWVEKKLAETQALVDSGMYSKSSMELDRRDYESNLKDIENGTTLTLIEYADGSYSVHLTFPVDGYEVEIGDDGNSVIYGN